MFSQKLCKQIKSSCSSLSPSSGLYPWLCSPLPCWRWGCSQQPHLGHSSSAEISCSPCAATAKSKRLKKTEPPKSCSSVLATGTTRALASLCNSRNEPLVCFLACSPILLCEPHWSCSHCCHTETSSFSPQMLLSLTAEMNLCPGSGKKTRKMDLPCFSTWTRNRGLASSAQFCVIWCKDDCMFVFSRLLIVLFHTPEWGKLFLDSEHRSFFQTILTGWHLKRWAPLNMTFLWSPGNQQSAASPSWLFPWSSHKTLSSFRGQNSSWIKHRSQPVFDVQHVCFARSLSWGWNQSAQTGLCTGWQKQQKDPLLLGEKPHVVTSLWRWLFSTWLICVSNLTFEGNWRKTL